MGAYREFPPARALHPLVACRWVREVSEDEGSDPVMVLPDGCVDLLWRDGRVVVAGPDRAVNPSPVRAGETIVGLRLRPGVAGAVLGMPTSEVVDSRVPLPELLGPAGSEVAERLGDTSRPEEAFLLLEEFVATRAAAAGTDPLVLAATRRLGFPGCRVDQLAEALGISDRQLRRRFHRDVGYGPKTLDRVLRFRRFVSRAREVADGGQDLAWLAADLGYADQAHLTRDCVRLSGLPPGRLAATWAH